MATSNIGRNEERLQAALGGVPEKFRKRILQLYFDVKKRYARASKAADYDSAGLSAGKLAETVLRLVQSEVAGTYIAFGKHISNFPDECRRIIQDPGGGQPESLRIIIPRLLVLLYTLRGKRGIGHVGGDVDANQIDLKMIVQLCDWLMCELIRIYHNLPLVEAQPIVDALSTRAIPDIWHVVGKMRVLRTDLNFKQKVLLLAYDEMTNGLSSSHLFEWTEHSNFAVFKKTVLKVLHKEKFIEYDKESQTVYISPRGIAEVEDRILAAQ